MRDATSLDERLAAEERHCGTNCGACLNQCGDAPSGMPFPVAVIRRDLWTALRFAATDQAIAQLDEQATRLDLAPCGEAESVPDFHLRIVDASLAAVSRARDAAWRAAVEAVRSEHRLGSDLAANGAHTALRELLARMESQP